LREKQVDGIIFMGGRINSVECPPVLAEEVVNLSKHIPIVLVNGTLPGNPLPRVKTDEYVGAEMVTEHLIELGHRKIGFIGGMEETTTTVEKVAAFESTLKKHGISPRKDWIRYGDFSVACGRKLMSGLLKERDRPTAVFCVNDFTSVGAIKAAIEAGLSIPDDVAIVGFDDTPLASSIIPELTTVSQESNRLGVTAFHVLQRLINGEQVEELSVIQPRLLVRESTVKK
jgi:LacI family transcriptional regulator/LacI family purine nucleotide synthesis repressor